MINLYTWMDKIDKAIKANPTGFREFDEYTFRNIGLHVDISEIAKRLHTLELFGYENLANISYQIFEKNPHLGFESATIYLNYLTWGFSKGVGAFRTYGKYDLWGMAFLRIHSDKTFLKLPVETPSDYYITLDPVNFNIITNVDKMELNSAINRGPDGELTKIKSESQKAFHNYEFKQYINDCKKMDEIIIERLKGETTELYKKSNLLKGLLYHGGQIGASLGIAAVPDKYSLLLRAILKSYPITKAMEPGSEKISHFVMKKWFFKEKGLPCLLWDYNIGDNPKL
jgi:hypothetical protein